VATLRLCPFVTEDGGRFANILQTFSIFFSKLFQIF